VSTLFEGVPRGLNLPQKIVTGTRVIVWDGKKKYNLVSVYDWPIIMIGPGGLLSEDLSPICNPRFSFLGRVVKKENPKLGCEKYFCSHNDWSRWFAIRRSFTYLQPQI
jgi:hypothetical protein